ncbi:c-type cytochrome [Jeotgalicoccus meleagridis]|uniref:Cytochrome c-550 n=1 Tax=Jeotgalicoccus meleagridis TaxID=2759181 RepID=A0A6V7RJC1_9STAP|nr:cytochrome c [Jeotgalicoccus meleagridis]CAD2078197.1 Cytochrome c-550 [Jeotgalicoccus meleagridis]
MNKNPIIPFLLIIFLGIGLVFLLSGVGSTDEGEEDVATEEGSEESGGGDEASSGDVDAEGIALDNCASCHGQDFSGGMGPALAGTSLDEETFTTTVRDGKGSMPAFSADQIADEELTALYQFFSEQ